MRLIDRAHVNMNLATYATASQFVPALPHKADTLSIPDDQYVLRMLVKKRGSPTLWLPPELQWLEATIERCRRAQRVLSKDDTNIYVTVRSGPLRSVDDDVWHADGFSMRTAHEPEQNYVWTSHSGTEHLHQNFDIPQDFDPLKHNIHQYFQDTADKSNVRVLAPEHLHLIDPYIVHRRPKLAQGTHRTFFRISFVSVLIEDDKNTPNPRLPVGPFNREDMRSSLVRYPVTKRNV